MLKIVLGITIVVILILIVVTMRNKRQDAEQSEIKSDIPKPNPPEKIRIEDLGKRGLIISWHDVPGANSYNLYVADDDIMLTNVHMRAEVTSPYIYAKDKAGKTKCYFAVTAVSWEYGVHRESDLSNVISANCGAKRLQAPSLRCYDHFEFPNEGSFKVKTCGSMSSSAPTRIFLQWFPVQKADKYYVYCNHGPNVSKSKYTKKWEIPGSSYYFESEKMTGDGCFSLIVTAVDKHGLESDASKIYTTCHD